MEDDAKLSLREKNVLIFEFNDKSSHSRQVQSDPSLVQGQV